MSEEKSEPTVIRGSEIKVTRLDEHGMPTGDPTVLETVSVSVSLGDAAAEPEHKPEADPLIQGTFNDMISASLVFELMSDADAGLEVTPPGEPAPTSWHRNVLRIGRVLLVKPTLEGPRSGPSGEALQPLMEVIPKKEAAGSTEENPVITIAETAEAVARKSFIDNFGVDIPKTEWHSFATTITAARNNGTDADGNIVWGGPRYAVKWSRAFVSTTVFDSIGRDFNAGIWDVWKLDAREALLNRWTDPRGEEGTFGQIEPELMWILPLAMWGETVYSDVAAVEVRWDSVPKWAKASGMGKTNFSRSGAADRGSPDVKAAAAPAAAGATPAGTSGAGSSASAAATTTVHVSGSGGVGGASAVSAASAGAKKAIVDGRRSWDELLRKTK